MLRVISFAACFLAIYVTASKAEDDLDARIARIERENAQLKKMLKVQDLERENAALRARVASGRSSVAHAAVNSAPVSAAASPTRSLGHASASAGGARLENVRHEEASETFAKYVPVQPTAIAKRWQGFYIGGHLGLGWGGWGSSEQISPTDMTAFFGAPALIRATSAPLNLSAKGAVVGGQAGYSWQVGNVALGVEGDLSVSTFGAATRRYITPDCTAICISSGPFTVPADASVQWLSSFRGRLGWADDRWHLFVSAGLAATGMENEITAGSVFTRTVRESALLVGYALGSGLAYAINPQVSFRAEYLRYQFPDTTQNVNTGVFTIPDPFGGPPTSVPQTTYSTINASTNVVRVGLDWRLN